MFSNDKVFIIAEAGVNHNKDMKLAKQLIAVAKDANADAVKFQTFISELEIDSTADRAAYQIANMEEGVKSQLEMAQELELPQSAFKELKTYADGLDIEFLSTPFDPVAVATLAEMNVPAYKLSSCCLINYPLQVLVSRQGKPVILSSGMSTLDEIDFGVKNLKKQGVKKIGLLHCVSNYPAALEDCNLLVISHLIEKYPDVVIGWSDHTLGNLTAVMAVGLGAKIVEKHYTLDKNLPGPDHAASSTPEELAAYIEDIRAAETAVINGKPGRELATELGLMVLKARYGKTGDEALAMINAALGDGKKKIMLSEANTAEVAKRSLYSYGPIPAGKIITVEDLLAKRPPGGISPTLAPEIIGTRAIANIGPQQRLDWTMVQQQEPLKSGRGNS